GPLMCSEFWDGWFDWWGSIHHTTDPAASAHDLDVLLAAGAIAAAVSTLAKWAIVGVIRAGEQPLWSSFVWRTEVSDTFTEMVAAPWFARSAAGTPAL
ncbi:hypothetical protein ACUX2S_25670, partial [Salmonella enterica]